MDPAGEANAVLAALYDRRGEYVLLEDLRRLAALDAVRVERALGAIALRGHELRRSPREGVSLTRPVRMDGFLVERGLGTVRVGRSVLCFGEVGSTNDVAMDAARRGEADGLVVSAESQRTGRGRFGHSWISRPGANLLLSAVLAEPEQAPGPGGERLTLAAGLAVAEGIADAVGAPCRLKWPNDVLIDGAKVSGILVETGPAAAGRVTAIGMGINVNDAPPRERVDRPPACLSGWLGEPVERVEVARCVLRRLDDWLGRLEAGDHRRLRDRWIEACGMLNERVSVTSPDGRYVGRVLDIGPEGELTLACDNGARVRLSVRNARLDRP